MNSTLYIAVQIRLDPYTTEFKEILFALLDHFAFEGMCENEAGIIAYIEDKKLELTSLKEIHHTLSSIDCSMEWTTEHIPSQNWNALWESNFEPVLIDKRCVIRAPFHASFSHIPICITIEPKMSFGTGHHQTTRLMIEEMLETDFKHKKVLDMGCGTGVLGILASRLNAATVTCIDNDTWAYQNTLENITKNNVSNVHVTHGGKETIPNVVFDIVLANINRNILIDQMADYAQVTSSGSLLLMSGILTEDSNSIIPLAEELGFQHQYTRSLNGWIMILCKRI
jgi:ribosomal protein L11 methyltransferase